MPYAPSGKNRNRRRRRRQLLVTNKLNTARSPANWTHDSSVEAHVGRRSVVSVRVVFNMQFILTLVPSAIRRQATFVVSLHIQGIFPWFDILSARTQRLSRCFVCSMLNSPACTAIYFPNMEPRYKTKIIFITNWYHLNGITQTVWRWATGCMALVPFIFLLVLCSYALGKSRFQQLTVDSPPSLQCLFVLACVRVGKIHFQVALHDACFFIFWRNAPCLVAWLTYRKVETEYHGAGLPFMFIFLKIRDQIFTSGWSNWRLIFSDSSKYFINFLVVQLNTRI
jgi:hypothetical protein